MPTVMILGPSLDSVIEPMPGAPSPTPDALAGRRHFAFDVPPTAPGGNVNLVLQPAVAPTDVMVLNVYAFFVQPVSGVPAVADRTADWFFKSGAASSSLHAAAADATTGKLTITVPGVKSSLDPYFVQVIFEFSA